MQEQHGRRNLNDIFHDTGQSKLQLGGVSGYTLLARGVEVVEDLEGLFCS